ncbi:MAG: CopD family protein [Candidatus Rokubacteria bacterium]|nr:CopD family protein [Candidatus Rokubacteria bacterium]MBI3826618.1 CopD family protein [Candidatus Rokubacteria bacterium]
MTGFLDVVLRGLLLAWVSLAVGGVAWARLVLRAEPGTKPDAATRGALRVVAGAAALAALTQASVLAIVAGDLARSGLPAAAVMEAGFALTGLARVIGAASLAVLASRLARRPAGAVAWWALAGLAVALVASSAALSHAVARMQERALLLGLDAAHQAAVAVWVGGLAHLTLYARRRRHEPEPRDLAVVARFSIVATASVAVLAATGLVLAVRYVGDPGALVGTAYGVMVLSKVVLFLAALGLALANWRRVRRVDSEISPATRLARFVEVELGLGLTVLFAAASLTSLPPAADVVADRATPREVAARLVPAPPRLASPAVGDLIRAADPLMAPVGERRPIERAWSEYNHHWAGIFVLAMGALALLEAAGVRAARPWPLLFLGLGAFLFARNDPRAWPLGPAGFWESMTLPDVLQHRAFVALVIAFGVFEWMVRSGRLAVRPWGYVFPLLCAGGGGLLLTHSHAMFNLKDEFLTEVTHTPIAVLGVFAGWGRWLELRWPEGGAWPGWLWRACLAGVGAILLVYREG